MKRRLGEILIAAALLAGCGATPQPTSSEPVDLRCHELIDHINAPPETYNVVADVVAFNPAQLSVSSPPGDPDGRLWAKDGLVIRAGAQFEILAPTSTGEDLTFGWGSIDGVSAIRVPACEFRGSDWMVYAGGWTPRERGCYDVFIRVDGVIESVQMAIGAPCDPQT
ncbi:MAG: hypothetical protein HKO10_08075 [Acidimicrobiia bacterium]|nr:hypothetical protein [Acidimicrobiia bacterium]